MRRHVPRGPDAALYRVLLVLVVALGHAATAYAQLATPSELQPSAAREETAPVAPPLGSPPISATHPPEPAVAMYQAPAAPAATVPVALHADRPGRLVDLYAPGSRPDRDVPVVRCRTPCVAHVPPASYRVYIHAEADTLAGSRTVNLAGPSYVTVTPDEPTERWLGLGLGIGGVVAIPTGLVLILVDALNDVACIGDEPCRDTTHLAVPGVLLLLAGLVATPVGWILFGQSFKPDVTVQPARVVQPTGALPLRVGIDAHQNRAGLRLGVTF
jgi:hypothetical protein